MFAGAVNDSYCNVIQCSPSTPLFPRFSTARDTQLQRQLSLVELSTKTDEELKAMLFDREAWHALADVQDKAEAGCEEQRRVLVHHAHTLQVIRVRTRVYLRAPH